jgi:hypothetical protein
MADTWTFTVRLEAITGADNPYSLLQVFGRGHVISKSGAVDYMTELQSSGGVDQGELQLHRGDPEPPVDKEAEDELPEDVEAEDKLPESEEAEDELPEDVEAVDDLPWTR